MSVETLRRERVTLDHRAHELRAERDQLAAHDPVRLREDLAGAETARLSAEAAVAAADEAFAAATAPCLKSPCVRPPATRLTISSSGKGGSDRISRRSLSPRPLIDRITR